MLFLKRPIQRYPLGTCLSFRSLSRSIPDDLKRNQNVRERDLEDAGTEASLAPSEVKVREFFQKYKPPAKPSPPQPKKEWLLRRQPEPEEVFEKFDHGPRAGDIFAESAWLRFGNHVSGHQKLITDTPEFNRIAKDVEVESQLNRATRPRASSPSRHIPAFTRSPSVNSHVPSSNLDHPPMDWSEEANSKEKHPGSQAYDDLDKYFAADMNNSGGPKQQASDQRLNVEPPMMPRRFVDEKNTRAHESINPIGLSGDRGPFKPYQGSQPAYAGSPNQSAQSSVEHSSQQENALAQLVMEELSVETHVSTEEQSKAYDYKPSLPKWLDPPDGDAVGAVPQREYNDFSPSKTMHDFWTESSAIQFDDPGQDPEKPDRHKLWGQEYWVAKPMLMEKYDYGEDENAYTADTGKSEDLDPEIPLHFMEENGTLAQLSIPEMEDYSQFFDTDEIKKQTGNKRRLFSMADTDKMTVKTFTMKQGKVRVSGKVLNGYTVPQGEAIGDDASNKWNVDDWLYDTPTPRDDGFSRYYDTAFSGIVVDDEEVEPKDGYGKYDIFVQERQLPVPSSKRVEEVKELEGLKEIPIKQVKAAVNGVSSKIPVDFMADADLQRLAEAESRYRDIFTNEMSDELPDLTSTEKERIESLRMLNSKDVREERPSNNLLKNASPDSDQWMLKEIEKLRKQDGIVEDPFSLVCQPKMLELAFASLRKRRPGSVPKSLENNFFEMASRVLLTGEMKTSSIAPVKPHRDAGKGARSTRIPSHPKPRRYED